MGGGLVTGGLVAGGLVAGGLVAAGPVVPPWIVPPGDGGVGCGIVAAGGGGDPVVVVGAEVGVVAADGADRSTPFGVTTKKVEPTPSPTASPGRTSPANRYRGCLCQVICSR